MDDVEIVEFPYPDDWYNDSKMVGPVIENPSELWKGLSRLLRSAGMSCRDFAPAEQFLAELDPEQKSCVLLDIE